MPVHKHAQETGLNMIRFLLKFTLLLGLISLGFWSAGFEPRIAVRDSFIVIFGLMGVTIILSFVWSILYLCWHFLVVICDELKN